MSPDDPAGLVPKRSGRLARRAVSALRRHRRRIGILGARDDECGALLSLFEELDCDATLFLGGGPDAEILLGPRAVDLFVALHDEATRAAAGAPLPSYAPVVCAFGPGEALRAPQLGLVATQAPFAPVLRTRLDAGFDALRPIVKDGLALRQYMQEHPDDDQPVGRALRPEETLDVIVVNADGYTYAWMSRFTASVERCMRQAGRVRVSWRGDGDAEAGEGKAHTLRVLWNPGDALAAFEDRVPDVLWTNQDIVPDDSDDGEELLKRLRPLTQHRVATVYAGWRLDGSRDWGRCFEGGVGAGALLLETDVGEVPVALRNAARMRRAFVHAGAC